MAESKIKLTERQWNRLVAVIQEPGWGSWALQRVEAILNEPERGCGMGCKHFIPAIPGSYTDCNPKCGWFRSLPFVASAFFPTAPVVATGSFPDCPAWEPRQEPPVRGTRLEDSPFRQRKI